MPIMKTSASVLTSCLSAISLSWQAKDLQKQYVQKNHKSMGFFCLSLMMGVWVPLAYADDGFNDVSNTSINTPIAILEPIVISATRSQKTLTDSPVTVQVLDTQTLAKHHAHALKDAIALLPNVNLRPIHGKAGHEVIMQGMGGDQVLVLIDGLPLTASTGSTVNLNQYLNAEVAQIEVIQGASSAQYGSSAMGGVINVITKKIHNDQPIKKHVDIQLASNSKQNPSQKTTDNNVTHLEASIDAKLDDKGQWLGRVLASYHDDKGLDDDMTTWERIKDASKQKQMTAKLVYRPNVHNDKKQAWFEMTKYDEDNISKFKRQAGQKHVQQQREENIDKTRHVLGFLYQFDPNEQIDPNKQGQHDKNHLAHHVLAGSLQGSLLFEDYHSHANTFALNADNDIISTPVLQRQANIGTYLAQLQYNLPKLTMNNSTHLLQVGAQWQQDKLSQRQNGNSELMADKVKRDAIEAYVQDDWLLGDDWELLTGIRYQYDSDFGKHIVPKTALRHTHIDDDGRRHVWRASIGQGYRVPNLKERHFLFDHSAYGYKVLGNPNLQPETSTSYQLGYQRQLNDHADVAFNLYYNDIKNLIGTDYSAQDGNIQIFRYENVSDALTFGGDVSGNWQIDQHNLLGLSYAHTKTKNKQTKAQLVGRPQHTAMLTWLFQLNKNLEFINQLKYESKHLVDSKKKNHSPGWFVVNSKINYQLNPNVNVHVGVNNLFDRQKDADNDNDFSPVDNRQWLAGASFNF